MATLVRLEFHSSPERVPDLAAEWDSALLPLLRTHGLDGPSAPERQQATGVFSRLFEVADPAQLLRVRAALRRDDAWQGRLQALQRSLGTPSGAGPARRPYQHLSSVVGTLRDLDGAGANCFDCRLAVYRTVTGAGSEIVAGAGTRHGPWLSLGEGDGLPSTAVSSLRLATDGRVWLSAMGAGVCWYDGARFGLLTPEDGLPFTDVGCIAQDAEGVLWFGTRAGLCRYDGETVEVYTEADGLACDGICDVVTEPGGVVWVATDRGLSRRDGSDWRTYRAAEGLTDGEVHRMLVDDAGVLWAGTNEGLGRIEGDHVALLTTEDGLPGLDVEEVARRGTSELWLALYGVGVCCLADGQVTVHRQADGVPGDRVSCLAVDAAARLWVGTHGNGVAVLEGSRWTSFTTVDGLSSSMITALASDRDGTLWCGTWGGGVSRYEGSRLTTWTRASGLPSDGVMAVIHDRRGGLWVGTWEGAIRFSDGDVGRGLAQNVLPGANVWGIVEDLQGRIWLETHDRERHNGLACWDGAALVWPEVPAAQPAIQVHGLAARADGTLLCGTQGDGLFGCDGGRLVSQPLSGLPRTARVTALHVDRQGRWWVGTDTGLVVLGADGCAALEAGTREQTGADVPWQVESILETRGGAVWLATRTGAVRYSDGQFRQFAQADGLSRACLTCALEDQRGRVWFGTWGAGLCVYDGEVWQRLTRLDGLVHDVVQDLSEGPDGAIWIGTEGGLMRYRPTALPPTVALTAVVADRRHDPSTAVEVPVSAGLLAMEFLGHSLSTRPGGLVYLYRLIGVHEDWRQTRRTRVEYQDLPVGRFTFEVQAVDRDLNRSPAPARIEIEVAPDPVVEGLSAMMVPDAASERFVGVSAALRTVQSQLRQAAATPVTVLILGETGTGKGLAARFLHAVSPRRSSPFITVTCGALPDDLVESELFGHEKGSFTGAVSRQLGKAELAGDGTIFLDEIGDLPLVAQAKLLRLLEEGTYERIGGRQTLRLRARVVAATNRDLGRMVARGELREDLYYRLRVYVVPLPPLRERREDVPLLAACFARRMAAHLDKGDVQIAPEAIRELQGYPWPGNVRELQHAVERAVVVCPRAIVRAEDLLLDGRGAAAGGPRLCLVPDDAEAPRTAVSGAQLTERAMVPGRAAQTPLWATPAAAPSTGVASRSAPLPHPLPADGVTLSLREQERRHILEALESTGWVIKGPYGAARLLDINEGTLRSRMRKLGIRRPR